MMMFFLAFAMTFSLIAPASAANGVYTVPKNGKIKSGVYENGKLLIPGKNSKEVQPINNAVRVKSTIFYSEFYRGEVDQSCGGMVAEYNLKMKVGKSTVKTLKDRIRNLSGELATDGNYLYYAAIESDYTTKLIRLSADGKSRKVLATGVEDFWAHDNTLYYVTNKTLYTMNMKTLKSTMMKTLEGSIYTGGLCYISSYNYSPNGIIIWEPFSEGFSTTTLYMYDYKTKKTNKFNVTKPSKDGMFWVFDVDLKNKRLLTFEFVNSKQTFVMRDFKGKKIKDVHTLTYLSDTKNSKTWSKPYESIDIVKKQITYVNGTKLATKKF